MPQRDKDYAPKKRITLSDILWSIFFVSVGFLFIYIFYLLCTDIKSSTLYQEILHR